MSIKFISDKSTLLSVIQPALHASSTKTTLPVLEGLLFKLEGNDLTVCGYDLEKGIRTSTQVYGASDGSVVLNAQKISGIIKNFSDGEIRFECDEKFIVNIIGGMSDFSIHGIDGEAFPALPELTGDRSFSLDSGRLRDIIHSTSHAVAQTDARPILTGEYFEVSGNSLTVVAADNYRLAICEESGMVSGEAEHKFIVPGKTLGDLVKLIDGDEHPVGIELTRKYIIFNYNGITLFSRILEGEYLDYKKVIPSPGKTFVKINRRDFIECVERASLLVDEKMKTPLRCRFSGGLLNIRCSTQYGKVNDNINIELTGQDIEIGFNNRYLLDALRASKDEFIILTMFSPLMSMTITPVEEKEDSKYLFLVLPMRLKD